MFSIIKVSLYSENGAHDQTYWWFTPAGGLQPTSINAGEEHSRMLSGINSFSGGIIYNFDEKNNELKIAFKSSESINGYSGYSIVVSYNENDKDSIFADHRAVEYADCRPEWIKNGITKESLAEELANPQSWLKRSDIEKLENLTADERCVVAVIVDKLLSAKKAGRYAKCGIVVSDNITLKQAQRLLKVALGLLPVNLSNRCSYNFNSNFIVGGLDLFCSSESKEKLTGADLIDISYSENGKLNFNQESVKYLSNAFAEFLKEADTIAEFDKIYEIINNHLKNLPETADLNANVELVDYLNKNVLMLVLERESKEKIATASQLSNLQKRFEECEKAKLIPTPIVDIEFTAVAYRIFFWDWWFNIPKMHKEFFKQFLSSEKVKYGDIKDKDNCANAFWMPDDQLYKTVLSNYEKDKIETVNYLNWLWEQSKCGDSLLEEIRVIVEDFLYSVNDEKHKSLHEVFKAFWDKLNDEDFNEYLRCFSKKGKMLLAENSFTLSYLKQRYNDIKSKINFYKNMRDTLNETFKHFISVNELCTNENSLKCIWSIIWDKSQKCFKVNKEELPKDVVDKWKSFFISNHDNELELVKPIKNFFKSIEDDDFKYFLSDCEELSKNQLMFECFKDRLAKYDSKIEKTIEIYKASSNKIPIEWIEAVITKDDFMKISDFNLCAGNNDIKQYFHRCFKMFLYKRYADNLNEFREDKQEIEKVAKEIGYALEKDETYIEASQKLKAKFEEEKSERIRQEQIKSFEEVKKFIKVYGDDGTNDKTRKQAIKKNLTERKKFSDKLSGKIGKFTILSLLFIFLIIVLPTISAIIICSILEKREILSLASFIENKIIFFALVPTLAGVISLILYIVYRTRIKIKTPKINERNATKEGIIDITFCGIALLFIYLALLAVAIAALVLASYY